MSHQGSVVALTGKAADAAQMIAVNGSTDAMTAVETTKESLWEAEVNRMAGEIALKSPEPDAAKAEAYFERALAVARDQRQSPGKCARR
jgi:hypothetical protein